MIHIAYFSTLAAAQAAAAAAIPNAQAIWLAQATAAGQSPATATPVEQARIESVAVLPAGALPTTAPAFRKVTLTVTASDGRQEKVTSYQPLASLPTTTPTAGTVRFVTTTNAATVRLRARVAAKVQGQALGGATCKLNGAVTLPGGGPTIIVPVDSTASFPAAGWIWLNDQLAAYTSKNATNFNGVGSGSSATFPDGATVSGNIAMPSGLRLQDPISGKTYVTTGTQNISANGLSRLTVAEANAADLGDVSYGSVLQFVDEPPVNVAVLTRVIRMASVTVGNATLLTDAAGNAYSTSGPVTLSDSADSLTGNLEATTKVIAVAPTPDTASAKVGDIFTLTVAPTGVVATPACAAALGLTVPNGQAFSRAAPVATYKTTAAGTLGDTQGVTVPFVADAGQGATADCPTTPQVVAVTSPPAGVSASATIPAGGAIPSAGYPVPLGAQVIGAPPDFQTVVEAQPDGRFRVKLYTVPLGS